MLIRFEASNFRSIAEPIELSMVAVDRERSGTREAPMLNESLLTVAAVYGPNASGKSNVLSALNWLRDAVQDSVRFWEDTIPVDPFAFGAGQAKPSEFALDMTVGDVRFEYVLELDSERVHYEALFHFPEKKRRRIFEREGSELRLQRGLGNLSGTRELLTDRTLVLSIARRFDEPLVSEFAGEVLNIQTLGPAVSRHRGRRYKEYSTSSRTARSVPTERWFEESSQESLFSEYTGEDPSPQDREQALALLRLADLGIEDVVIDSQEATIRPDRVVVVPRFRLAHRTRDTLTPLEFAEESQGTRTWFQLIGPILTALRYGSTIIFDELDGSLHPLLSAELLHIFQSPEANPHGAQLVFSTHDTSLLGHLNRDEVWLTEKRDDGSTRLGALAEFAGERVRRSRNLESGYLHGRFGALPQVDQMELLRSLGLIG